MVLTSCPIHGKISTSCFLLTTFVVANHVMGGGTVMRKTVSTNTTINHCKIFEVNILFIYVSNVMLIDIIYFENILG